MNQIKKNIKVLFVETFWIFTFSEDKKGYFSSLKCPFSPHFCSFVFLILLSFFFMHVKHSYSRLCIWTCLLPYQPLLSGLLLHTTISAKRWHCITLQILGFLSLITCAFFLSTYVPDSKHKYQNIKYQPHLYGNHSTKRHKCRLI